jgi:hypothetical protein
MVAIVGEYKVNARHISYNVMARDRCCTTVMWGVA